MWHAVVEDRREAVAHGLSHVRPRRSGHFFVLTVAFSLVCFSPLSHSFHQRFDPRLFNVRRLWLNPFLLSSCSLQCDRLHHVFSLDTGVLGRRGYALESAAARVCREAGALCCPRSMVPSWPDTPLSLFCALTEIVVAVPAPLTVPPCRKPAVARSGCLRGSLPPMAASDTSFWLQRFVVGESCRFIHLLARAEVRSLPKIIRQRFWHFRQGSMLFCSRATLLVNGVTCLLLRNDVLTMRSRWGLVWHIPSTRKSTARNCSWTQAGG